MNTIKNVNFTAKSLKAQSRQDNNNKTQSSVVSNTLAAGVTAGVTTGGAVAGGTYGSGRIPKAINKKFFKSLFAPKNLKELSGEEKTIASSLVTIAKARNKSELKANINKLPGGENIIKFLENEKNDKTFKKILESNFKRVLYGAEEEEAKEATSQLRQIADDIVGKTNREKIEKAVNSAEEKGVFKELPENFFNKLEHLPKKAVAAYAAGGALIAGTTAVLGSALVSKLTSKKQPVEKSIEQPAIKEPVKQVEEEIIE